MHIIYMLLQIMADRRLQSLLEASKRGLTLRFDPPTSRNGCFYRCLAKFVNVQEDDVVEMTQSHLICNQVITCADEIFVFPFIQLTMTSPKNM